MEYYAKDATRLLLKNYPDVAEKMMQKWADAKLSPLAAVDSMPWGQVKSSDHYYRARMVPLPEIDICKRLGQFLKYVIMYRNRLGELDDVVVYKLLLLTSTPGELRAYLTFLEDHRDMHGGSEELVKALLALLALHTPSEKEMARTVVILSNLREQHPLWSTATVDRLQALPNA